MALAGTSFKAWLDGALALEMCGWSQHEPVKGCVVSPLDYRGVGSYRPELPNEEFAQFVDLPQQRSVADRQRTQPGQDEKRP
jgi:hypothetical protein